MKPHEPNYETFMKFSPLWYVRKATGERVMAIESVTMWKLEDFKVGAFVVMDGPRIYRSPPKRFWMIFDRMPLED